MGEQMEQNDSGKHQPEGFFVGSKSGNEIKQMCFKHILNVLKCGCKQSRARKAEKV